MTEKKYQVLFYGELAPGKSVETVKEQLARAFKADKKKIDALFSGKKRVIKKDASREACEKTRKVFESAGAVCAVIPQGEPNPEPPDLAQIAADFASGNDIVDTDASLITPEQAAPPTRRVNKAVLLLLTFFLGFLGIHKHYLGRSFQGMLYLLFCWTGIPTLAALVEFIIFAVTGEEALNEKYTAASTPLVIIMAVFSPLIALALTTLVTAILFYYVLTSHGEPAVSGFLKLLVNERMFDIRPGPTASAPRHGIIFPENEDTRTGSSSAGPTGSIKGFDFTAEHVLLQNGVLHLKQGSGFFADLEIIVFLFADVDDISGKTFEVSSEFRSAETPHIHLRWKSGGEDTPRSDVILGKYDMRLVFETVIEKPGEKSMAGHIDLNIPGDKATRVTGPFIATVKERTAR